MSARMARKLCRDQGKVRYRDEAAAIWGGQRQLRVSAKIANARHRLAPGLWVYRCPSCLSWHLTSHPRRNGSRERQVPYPTDLED